jgi:hypothetical protein
MEWNVKGTAVKAVPLQAASLFTCSLALVLTDYRRHLPNSMEQVLMLIV